MRSSSPRSHRFFFLFASLAGILILTLTAWGQTGTTGVYGRVTDPQGAAVVGAKVTVKNVGTGAARTDATDKEGVYKFPSLQPGDYAVNVEARGFRTAHNESVKLLVDTQNKLDIVLQVGTANEIVEVQGTAEAVNTTDASVGNAFGENSIKSLPLEGRNVVALLSLQPGAVYLPVTTATTYPDSRDGSVSGGRADQTNVTLDGVDVNDNEQGFAYNSVLRNTADSVQEFRVTTSNYGAEQGRSSSAQVSLVTKSGTNNFHGSAYWAHRNTAFSSNEFFNKLSQIQTNQPNKPPKLQKHIWGWSFGGPVKKDRVFFFLNMENLRESSQSIAVRAIPSNTFRDGILSYNCAPIVDSSGNTVRTADQVCPAATVTGLSGATYSYPAGQKGLSPAELASIDPLGIGPSVAASQYFKLFPSPNAVGRDGFNFAEFRFAAPIKPINWTYIARFDFKLDQSGNNSVYWRGNLQDDQNPDPPQYPGQAPRINQLSNNKGFAVGYTSVLNPHLVNTLRYGFTRLGISQSGQRTSNYAFFRFFDEFTPQTSSNYRHIPTHNIVDDLSWNHGNHNLQFGTNIRFVNVQRLSNANSFIDATANGSWVLDVGTAYMPTGCPASNPNCGALPGVADDSVSGFADGFIDILGIMSEVDAVYNYDKKGNPLAVGTPIKRDYRNSAYEWYAQDNWRLKPNLNVVFGLRYSLSTPPYEVNGLQAAPTIDLGKWFAQRQAGMLAGTPDNMNPLVTYDLAGKANGKPDYFKLDKNNFAPRVAATWSPDPENAFLRKITGGNGKMVLRGGWGLVYDNFGQALASRIADFASYGFTTQLSSPANQYNEDEPGIRFVNLDTIPAVNTPAAPAGGFPTTPPDGLVDGPQGQITSGIDGSLSTPYSHVFNFFVGRELPGNMFLDVGYVGRRGHDLTVRRDLAMPLNLVDPASKVDYFTAVRQSLAAAAAAGIAPGDRDITNYLGLAPIPYWENLFPSAAGANDPASSATAEMVRAFNRRAISGDFTTPLYNADEFCSPGCSKYGPFAYFNRQFDSLGALSTLGRSAYDALQLTLRKRYSQGLQFDFNYTYSKASDLGSAVERGSFFTTFDNGGYTGFLINSWDPNSSYSLSDFDIRHQVNFNWIYDLPVGRGKHFSRLPGWANAILGDWQFSGIYRWTSGLPLSIFNCRSCWATNWNLQGNAQPIVDGKYPDTGHYLNVVDGNPSMFKDPGTAYSDFFRKDLPGEGSKRNYIRGDGYFNIDTGFGKSWKMPYAESHQLKFRWEIFNVTNSARFNSGDVNMTPDSANFGSYLSVYSGCSNAAGRCMQGSLRYEF